MNADLRWLWIVASIFTLGALFTVGIDTQRTMPLAAPLDDAIPMRLVGHTGEDVEIPEDAVNVAGMTNYLMRTYRADEAAGQVGAFSLYIGYYDRQTQGKTIHSPKNCLPGAGWEALMSSEVTIGTAAGAATVNRYLLQKDDNRALVLYWYQGRGRIQANEYAVKANLLRDAALRQRSEEALVRVVVPITQTEQAAFDTARRAAEVIVPQLASALPS